MQEIHDKPHAAPGADDAPLHESKNLPTVVKDGFSAGGNPPPRRASVKRKIAPRTIFFGVCAVLAILAFCIVNADGMTIVFTRLGNILTPLAIGGAIAYLLNPILNFYEHRLFRKLPLKGLRQGLSLFLTMVTGLGIVTLILVLILPELVDSITLLVTNLDKYLNQLLAAVQTIIDKITAKTSLEIDISDVQKLTAFLEDFFGSMEAMVSKLLTTLQSFVLDGKFLGDVWGFLKGVIDTLFDIILGLFIAFYILASKEKRIAQIRKVRAAFLSEKQDNRVMEIARLVDRTFGGFIKGVLLDALAVGVVTFILLSIFRVSEYNLLIAAICAVTNIIPVFGPFIGAIPSGFIVLISNPDKLLVFIILILVIQQIDGNIIVPRIQGNNMGISSLAVLVAITVMGSLFGVIGMIIGVPIFAVVIELCKQAIEHRLIKRGAPTDTTYYYPADAVGNAEEEVYYEHAHLRYKYEHSKLKVYVDKATRTLRKLRRARRIEHAARRRARRAAKASAPRRYRRASARKKK